MLASRRQKSKTNRESWEEALVKAGLATKENRDAILQHRQSLSVKLCIVFLGGKSALEQGCLDRILQCKDLKHALPAFTILANAQGGIKDDQVLGIMLDRAPESRKEAAHALRKLQESHLLTDTFKKAVDKDSWDGSERNQASSAIKAINTLISRDTKDLVTETHLRAVLRHDLPASVAEIIVDCYKVAGTEFIAQYMPSILRLNDIETEWLSSTIECLREHEVLTAGTVKGIFECCHIGSQEASKGDNARLKLHDDFTFSLFYDCVAHMNGCSFKDFSALVTQLKDPTFKLTNLPNMDQLKNPAFISLSKSINVIAAMFKPSQRIIFCHGTKSLTDSVI